MAEFYKNFFEAEIREGFYIESMMKRAWAVEIELLEEIDRICKKHNLRYFADSGTLLGAVRHRGFIPWDDDLDISMLREDYEKFVTVAKTELPEGYVMQDIYTMNGETARVLNSLEINFSAEYLEKFHGCPYVVGIDIFPLDNMPRNKEEEEILSELILLLKQILQTFETGKLGEYELESMLKELEQTLGVKMDKSQPMISQIIEQKEKLCVAYQNDECEEVTLWDWFVTHKNYRFKREWYDKTILLPFENIMIPAPKYYEKVLIATYGEDYMVPIKNTQSHEYPFYKKQQKFVENYKKEHGLSAKAGEIL